MNKRQQRKKCKRLEMSISEKLKARQHLNRAEERHLIHLLQTQPSKVYFQLSDIVTVSFFTLRRFMKVVNKALSDPERLQVIKEKNQGVDFEQMLKSRSMIDAKIKEFYGQK